MKVRQGFVSNSSSSSFIITGEDNIKKAQEIIENMSYGEDYYILEGVLYTSFISEYDASWIELNKIKSGEINGSHGAPYDEDYFVEFEGDRGCSSVYIDKDVILKSEKSKFYHDLLALDNKDVNDIMLKYKRVWEDEITKWLCK